MTKPVACLCQYELLVQFKLYLTNFDERTQYFVSVCFDHYKPCKTNAFDVHWPSCVKVWTRAPVLSRLSTNMVIYLTRIMGCRPAFAATQVNLFEGTCYLTPVLGAWLADAHWGRYKTILVFSGIYFVVSPVCISFLAMLLSPTLKSSLFDELHMRCRPTYS